MLGTAGVLATPVGLWIRWLRPTVWGNSMRAVALSRRMTAMFAGATIAYAGVASLAASMDLLFADEPTATLGATAAVAALLAAAIAALVVGRTTAPAVPREG